MELIISVAMTVILFAICIELLVAISYLKKLVAQQKREKTTTVPVSQPVERSTSRSESANLRSRGKTGRTAVEGIRICPRCYSAVDAKSQECPACKGALR